MRLRIRPSRSLQEGRIIARAGARSDQNAYFNPNWMMRPVLEVPVIRPNCEPTRSLGRAKLAWFNALSHVSAASSHESTVQPTPSSQLIGVRTHALATHASVPLQNTPSSQSGVVLQVAQMSLASSQVRPGHGSLLGWQSRTGSQVSRPSQNAPFPQIASSGSLSQESVASLQVSIVQLTASSQSMGVRTHWFATAKARDRALADMAGEHLYSRRGDRPTLRFEPIDRS